MERRFSHRVMPLMYMGGQLQAEAWSMRRGRPHLCRDDVAGRAVFADHEVAFIADRQACHLNAAHDPASATRTMTGGTSTRGLAEGLA